MKCLTSEKTAPTFGRLAKTFEDSLSMSSQALASESRITLTAALMKMCEKVIQ